MGNITVGSGGGTVSIQANKPTLTIPGPFAGGPTPTTAPTISGTFSCQQNESLSFCVLGNITNNDSLSSSIDVDINSSFSSSNKVAYFVNSGVTRQFEICGFSNPPGNITIYSRATVSNSSKPVSSVVNVSQNVTSCVTIGNITLSPSFGNNLTCINSSIVGEVTNNDSNTVTMLISLSSSFFGVDAYTVSSGNTISFSIPSSNPPGNVTVYAKATASGKITSGTETISQNIRSCLSDGGGDEGGGGGEPIITYTWVRIDGTDSQGGFFATYNIQDDGSDDLAMISVCQSQYPANLHQGATINYFNTAYGYFTLFQSTAT
jgi:hypothetical protein